MENTNASSNKRQPRLRSRLGTRRSSRVKQNPLVVSQSTDLKLWKLLGQGLDQVGAQLTMIENNQFDMCQSHQICLDLQRCNTTHIEHLFIIITDRFQIDLLSCDVEDDPT